MIKLHFIYHKPTKLREDNVFSRLCLSVCLFTGRGLQSHHIGPQLCTWYCLSLPDMFNFKQVVGILLECFLVQIYITYLINLKIVFIPDEPLYQLMVHYTSRAACESRVGRCFVCFFRPLTVMVNSPVIAKSNLTKRNPVNITLR